MKYLKLQTLQILGVLSLFILLGAVISITPNRTVAVHDAELRYIEKSNNMSLAGGVMPASCESYNDAQLAGKPPEYYTQHRLDDTNGHCIGSCPAGMDAKLFPYRKCAYEDLNTYVIPLTSSCLATAPWDSNAGLINIDDDYYTRVCVAPEAKTCLEFTAGCTCNNGALNTSYTDGVGGCDVCPTGSVYNTSNKSCEACGYDGCSGIPPRCLNGSLNAPTCYSSCRTGYVWWENSRCISTNDPDYCGGNTGKICQ